MHLSRSKTVYSRLFHIQFHFHHLALEGNCLYLNLFRNHFHFHICDFAQNSTNYVLDCPRNLFYHCNQSCFLMPEIVSQAKRIPSYCWSRDVLLCIQFSLIASAQFNASTLPAKIFTHHSLHFYLIFTFTFSKYTASSFLFYLSFLIIHFHFHLIFTLNLSKFNFFL